MSGSKGDNLHCFVGHMYPAADGGNYGIYVVGCIPEKNDLVVMTVAGGKVRYDEEPRRLDAFKAGYRYNLSPPNDSITGGGTPYHACTGSAMDGGTK